MTKLDISIFFHFIVQYLKIFKSNYIINHFILDNFPDIYVLNCINVKRENNIP